MAMYVSRGQVSPTLRLARRLSIRRSPSILLKACATPSRWSSTSSRLVLYQLIEDVERLEYYRPGGYHPIQIGDRFHERYRIVHKLGFGTFSTIWLARDEQVSKYLAIKVCTADAIPQEADTLSRLAEVGDASQRETPGRSLIPTVLDCFNIQGPNGSHTCFVTAPARCSLSDTREASVCGLFQLEAARSMAAQIALAVAYIHEQGLVHGGEHHTQVSWLHADPAHFSRPPFRQHPPPIAHWFRQSHGRGSLQQIRST
jgi:hypothetical protein